MLPPHVATAGAPPSFPAVMAPPRRLTPTQRAALLRVLEADAAGQDVDAEDWAVATGDLVDASDTACADERPAGETARSGGSGREDSQASPVLPEARDLPGGVTSLAEWGATVVTHGTTRRGLSYAEAAADDGYRRWVLQNTPQSPLLKDFKNYLLAAGHKFPRNREKRAGEKDDSPKETICFPNTSIPRVFKD